MDQVLRTVQWFEAAVPEATIDNINSQLGCHFEEVVEMLDEMVGVDNTTGVLIDQAKDYLNNLVDHLKVKTGRTKVRIRNHTKLLDALCDQMVTAVGVGHMYGYDVLPAFIQVNDSNYSKFVDGKPVFNENMKIMKGENYFKPDLSKFLVKY